MESAVGSVAVCSCRIQCRGESSAALGGRQRNRFDVDKGFPSERRLSRYAQIRRIDSRSLPFLPAARPDVTLFVVLLPMPESAKAGACCGISGGTRCP